MDKEKLRSIIINYLFKNETKSATQITKDILLPKNDIISMLKILEQENIVRYCGGHKWALVDSVKKIMDNNTDSEIFDPIYVLPGF